MCKKGNINLDYFFCHNLVQDSKRKASEMKIYKRQPVLHVDNTNDLTFTGIYGLTLSHMVVGVLLRGASSPVTMYDSSSCPVIQSGFFFCELYGS